MLNINNYFVRFSVLILQSEPERMKHFSTISETKAWIGEQISLGKTVGFVPTMGALHEGHLTLVRKAKAENDIAVSSVFVNPTQFNNKEDLAKYPRNAEQDAKMLGTNGCDLLFAPEVAEMYPSGEDDLLEIDFGSLDKVMEGTLRPGHFKGVATIVHRLFSIVSPTRAYFGKKDYQQLAIIREMVKKTGLPVGIIGCETIRERDGLAMSSRNMRLTPLQRQIAPGIYRILQMVKERAATASPGELQQWALEQLGRQPEFRAEYFEIGHRDTLLPPEKREHPGCSVAFAAVFMGDVRLIDNIELFS